MKIEAIALDFDGTLFDSEHFWHESENECLSRVGITLPIGHAGKTTGLRCDEVIKYWVQFFGLNGVNIDSVVEDVENMVSDKIISNGEPKPGAIGLVKSLLDQSIPFAVVSSSPESVVRAGFSKMGLEDEPITVFSALDDEFGKPHPAVYIRFLKSFGLVGEQAIALEDSFNGAIAAKAAKMCVAVVGSDTLGDDRFNFADYRLSEISEFIISDFVG